jgi:hypothetical protein
MGHPLTPQQPGLMTDEAIRAELVELQPAINQARVGGFNACRQFDALRLRERALNAELNHRAFTGRT